MTAYAATATWGIPGPAFLGGYLVAAAAIAVLATVHRRWLFAGPPGAPANQLGAQQVAYLNNGERLAVYTSLGGLRAAGALGSGPGGTLAQTGPMPMGATPLDTAVYNAAGKRIKAGSLLSDPWVRAATTRLRDDLEAAGAATTASQRRTARLWAVAGLALFAVGVARLVAGLRNDRPVGWLIAALLGVAVLTVQLWFATTHRTRAGTAALAELRDRNRHLAPASTPAYATYGAAGAAMGVALYGTASLYWMDPAFAAEAGIHRSAAAGSSSGGSSCSSGSSCGGGGGGCGGGGCGG